MGTDFCERRLPIYIKFDTLIKLEARQIRECEGMILHSRFANLMLEFETFSNHPSPELAAIEIIDVAAVLAIPVGDFLSFMHYRIEDVAQRILMRETLTVEQSKLLLGVCKMIKQVELISGSLCGSVGFDPGIWLGRWLRAEVPAFGDVSPILYISTQYGQAKIESFLLSAVSGSYR